MKKFLLGTALSISALFTTGCIVTVENQGAYLKDFRVCVDIINHGFDTGPNDFYIDFDSTYRNNVRAYSTIDLDFFGSGCGYFQVPGDSFLRARDVLDLNEIIFQDIEGDVNCEVTWYDNDARRVDLLCDGDRRYVFPGNWDTMYANMLQNAVKKAITPKKSNQERLNDARQNNRTYQRSLQQKQREQKEQTSSSAVNNV